MLFDISNRPQMSPPPCNPVLTKKHSAPATSLIVSCRGEFGEQNGGVHSTNRGDFKQQIGGDFIQEIRGSKYVTTRPRESRPSIMESAVRERLETKCGDDKDRGYDDDHDPGDGDDHDPGDGDDGGAVLMP